MIKTALTAASLALVATAAPAIAGDKDAPSTSVTFADLNLSTPEGQEMLDNRIDAAARAICQMDSQRTGTRINTSERRCYTNAKKSVKQQVATLIEDTQRGG